jgi:transcription antitermination factor NusG
MSASAVSAIRIGEPPSPMDQSVEPRWYAAYTSANHEKTVARQLVARTIEHFLPLYASVRRWSDRRICLQLPLFPGYVFVRIPLRERLRVLQVPGVAKLIGFGGLPSPLPDEQIERVRNGLMNGLCAEPHPYLRTGRQVRIKAGPLSGLEGILLRRRGKYRIVASVELLQRSYVVDVCAEDLEPAAT